MSDLFSALNSASGALRAFQTALDVTQNNVSNSQTPGYVTQVPTFDALGFEPNKGLDGGVQGGSGQSSRNPYAELAVRQQVTLLGSSSQLATSLDPIEQVFSVSGTSSISSAMDSLFQSFSAWSASPGDVGARTTVLNAASAVATAFAGSASQLNTIRSSMGSDLQSSVDSINQLADQIQQYNVNRQGATNSDPGLDAQLNNALEQLSQYADTQVLTASDGSVTVLLGGQVPLVTGSQVHHLSLGSASNAGAANPTAPANVSILDSDGNDVTANITDGQLGALLSVRNQILPNLIGGPSTAGQLNTLATQLASTVNNVLTNAGGQPLFTYDNSSAVDSAATLAVNSTLQPTDLVAADPGPPPVSNGVPLALSALANNSNAQLQNMTFDQFYGSTTSSIGNQLSQAQTASTAQTQTVAQARALRQQLSGVSLDEEATRLMELQRSYQAASRMVTVIDSLTETLINMIQ